MTLWYALALATVLAIAGIAAFLVLSRRRVLAAARSRVGARPGALGETWEGIGGPSFSPRPATTRIDVAPSGPEAAEAISPAPGPRGVTEGFDIAAFLQTAEQAFRSLQAAWDRADTEALARFATAEMRLALQAELAARAAPSHTEVLELEAELLGIESAPERHLASVRFTGALRVDGALERVDEVWNLSRPADGSGGWLLAGVQQLG